MSAKVIVITALSLLAIVVMLQNRASVPVQFLFWSVTMSRILLIFILLLVGFVIGYILHDMQARKKHTGD